MDALYIVEGLRARERLRTMPVRAWNELVVHRIGGILDAGGPSGPYGWAPSTVWRVSSVAIAFPVFLFVATVPGRRRAATGGPLPLFVRILLAVQACAGLALVLNALALFTKPGAVYGSAATAVLVSTGIAYFQALNTVLPDLTGRH